MRRRVLVAGHGCLALPLAMAALEGFDVVGFDLAEPRAAAIRGRRSGPSAENL